MDIERIKELVPEAEGFERIGEFYCFSVHGRQVDSSAGLGLALLNRQEGK